MKGLPINRLQGGRSVHGKASVQISPRKIQFIPGQIFQGKVIHQKANGSLLVTTGGKTFEARTAVSLAEGKSYSFLVRKGAPWIELKVMGNGDSGLVPAGKKWISGQKNRLLFGRLLGELASSQGLKNLKNLLPVLLYQGPAQADALWLSRNVLSSGIFWENKVFRYLLGRVDDPVTAVRENDFKGMLLFLKQEIDGSSLPEPERLVQMGRIDHLLLLLENHQELNLEALRNGWGWYWFLPGGDQSGLLHGELFGRKGEEDDFHHVHMDLFFSRLGGIHADCALRKRSVGLSLQVTDESVGRFLEKNIALLKKAIEKRGLSVTRITCETTKEANVFYPFSREEGGKGLMDVVI
ncbi:MAG: hypothetical protein DRG82_10000 [Deltaproteobacteria bacterium]|nr:MAG: hypothetical protein DRG82_10000 [Deltaproteobacteria bacterium]